MRNKSRFFHASSYILNVANVTKQDLIQDVTCATGIIRSEVKVVVEQFLDLVGETLAQGNSIEIRGFGTFVNKDRKARPARNPKTGDVVYLKQRTVPAFKFSADIKAAIAKSVAALQTTAESPRDVEESVGIR